MNIRKAGKEDITQLVEMRIKYLTVDCGEMSEEQLETIREQLPEYFERQLGTGVLAYAAEEEGVLVSTVFMVIVEKPANPHFITGKTGTLLNVYTRPEYRRQGLAGKLIDLVIQDAKQLNLSYIDLSASKEGYPLYKKIGFTESQSDFVPMKLLL
jgi:ribosomal protein S18 acetylase RimI-like enzyme